MSGGFKMMTRRNWCMRGERKYSPTHQGCGRFSGLADTAAWRFLWRSFVRLSARLPRLYISGRLIIGVRSPRVWWYLSWGGTISQGASGEDETLPWYYIHQGSGNPYGLHLQHRVSYVCPELRTDPKKKWQAGCNDLSINGPLIIYWVETRCKVLSIVVHDLYVDGLITNYQSLLQYRWRRVQDAIIRPVYILTYHPQLLESMQVMLRRTGACFRDWIFFGPRLRCGFKALLGQHKVSRDA